MARVNVGVGGCYTAVMHTVPTSAVVAPSPEQSTLNEAWPAACLPRAGGHSDAAAAGNAGGHAVPRDDYRLAGQDATTWDALQQTIGEIDARSGSISSCTVVVIIPIVVLAFRWPGLAASRLGHWYLPIFVVYYAIAAVWSHAAYTAWVINYAETAPTTVTLLGVIFSMES